jgi:hypothetical protein
LELVVLLALFQDLLEAIAALMDKTLHSLQLLAQVAVVVAVVTAQLQTHQLQRVKQVDLVVVV